MSKLGQNTRWHLLTGADWLSPFRTDEAGLRAAWTGFRDALLAEWIAAYPLTRPYSWWLYDAPELRRRVNGVHPFDDPAYQARAAAIRQRYPDGLDLLATYYGKPRHTGAAEWGAEYQSQIDYLARLDLLTAEELDVLANPDSAKDRAPLYYTDGSAPHVPAE